MCWYLSYLIYDTCHHKVRYVELAYDCYDDEYVIRLYPPYLEYVLKSEVESLWIYICGELVELPADDSTLEDFLYAVENLLRYGIVLGENYVEEEHDEEGR